MVSLESVKIEYKTGAVFGVLALVLSIAVGLAAGNTVLYSFVDLGNYAPHSAKPQPENRPD